MIPTNRQRRDARAIRKLKAELDTQAALLRVQEAAFVRSRRLFETAAAAAKMGVWECDLDDESLRWTDGVYDMFDLPRGSTPDRGETLRLYAEPSRKVLTELRTKAIRERSGFSLDAEIVTAKGRRRWIRITATVEHETAVIPRIFGVKQDITDEKALSERIRYLAEFDVMTGLANRGQFQAKLADMTERRDGRAGGALLLVDLDGFKQVNDTFGHAIGDACLVETAARLQRSCREADLVARIGGDEFAVLLGPNVGRSVAESVAGRIVAALGQPVERDGRRFKLGASVGVALLDGGSPSEAFANADMALYAAKHAGRNTFRTFLPDMTHGPTRGLSLVAAHAASQAPLSEIVALEG